MKFWEIMNFAPLVSKTKGRNLSRKYRLIELLQINFEWFSTAGLFVTPKLTNDRRVRLLKSWVRPRRTPEDRGINLHTQLLLF